MHATGSGRMLFSIAGKKALVTGAGSGIGQAIAVRLATEGAKCLLAGRNMAKLEATHREIGASKEGDSAHECLRLDVAREPDWKEAARRHIDILVNCAGTTGSDSALLAGTSAEQIEQILATNLRGAILGCKHVGKRMLAQKSGCIINVSSLLARKGKSGVSVYAASKAGLVGLTTSLAVELGRANVRVNAVLPGYIETSMTEDILRHNDLLLQRIPLGRFGTAEEVADAVAFLAKNPYASNCILNLDGGLSAT